MVKIKKIIIIFSIFTIILFSNITLNILQQNNFKSKLTNLKTSSDTGWVSPQTSANIDRDGNDAWDPTYLWRQMAQDDADAYVILIDEVSDWLRASNFGFSIPEGNQIDGIEVQYEKGCLMTGDRTHDDSVRLVVSAGMKGEDKAIGTPYPNSDTDTYTSYGGNSDLWSETWTREEVNSADFGIQISAIANAYDFAMIDHVQIKITYSEGEPPEEETDPPTWDTLTESADPLELGNTEIININIYDESTISNVYLEFDSSNHSMDFISGDTWRYITWIPITIGEKIYQIHMIDEYGNTNQTSDLIITVEDTVDPIISNIIESADPLELGNTETIQVDITDESSMTWVYLEFEGSNHSMSFVSGITWEYISWIPSSIGNFPYIIYVNDTSGNIISDSSGDITVEDTIDPVISNIVESADPLELTFTETIEVDITDESSMTWVYLEFEGSNHSMSFVSGITWEYTSWTPGSEGNFLYSIYANDTSGNIIFDDTGDITVENTTGEGEDNNFPTWDNLIIQFTPLNIGLNQTIWISVYDEANISEVKINILGINYSMIKVSNDTYMYTGWVLNSLGIKSFNIYIINYYGNVNNTESYFEVISLTEIIFSVIIMFLLIIGMIIFYLKLKVFLVILTIFLFSLIFGLMSISMNYIPFTPYLQVFFICIQTIFLLFTVIDLRKG